VLSLDGSSAHGNETVRTEHLGIVKPGMTEAQLLGTLYQFPGVGGCRHRNTKFHYDLPFMIGLELWRFNLKQIQF
jgi:hypothetical protein